MKDWKKNIPLGVRLQTSVRDGYIRWVYNPVQVWRRSSGLARRDLFQHVLIQTNYSCTRKCSFCHYGLPASPKKINMKKDLYDKIIEELAALNYDGRIGLFEMNEPLTDKRLPDLIAQARLSLPYAWIFITTNGDLLTQPKTVNLFDAGLNFMFLNSYDDQALERNLTMIEELPDSLRPRIHHINRTYQHQWSSRGGHIIKFRKPLSQSPCDLPFHVLYIKPSGTVHSCYNDFYDQNVMGDVRKNSIADVWFGERFQAFRSNLARGNRSVSPLCSQCDYRGFSNLPKISWSWQLKRGWGRVA